MITATPTISVSVRSRPAILARPDAAAVLLAGGFALLWLVSMSRSLFDPIGHDQALYQYITERVMSGERMYVDLWDQNAPGIVAIHWLSTCLVGTTPMTLRAFDAGWQVLTLVALAALAVREGRRWHVALLAASLYTLAYYGLGYVHTAQREGFAVLPLLLAVHATLPGRPAQARSPALVLRHVLGGVLGFAVFAIKPPLGLCFGVLWLSALQDAWRSRRGGGSAWVALAGLSGGFVLSAAAAVGLLLHLGWWEGFWTVLTRQDVPGYVRGPRMVRELAPYLVVGTVVIGSVVWMGHRKGGSVPVRDRAWWAHAAAGLVVFLLLLSVQRWPDWQQTFAGEAGLLIPALGAMLLQPWQERSRIWRVSALLAVASFAAIVWQGQFYLYHCPPLLAMAAYLTAGELADSFGRNRPAGWTGRLWGAVCLGCAAHLLVGTWGRTMTFPGLAPYVLADATLDEHYTCVTRHKTRFPAYDATAAAAERVRTLTSGTDPIACLIDEPRLYYLSRRPAVFPLLRTQACYENRFPAYLRAVGQQRPKVVLARVPGTVRGQQHPIEPNDPVIQSAVFDDLESTFGPEAGVIRRHYEITHVIMNDICILQPKRDHWSARHTDECACHSISPCQKSRQSSIGRLTGRLSGGWMTSAGAERLRSSKPSSANR